MASAAEYSVKNALIVNVISIFFVVAGIIAVFNINREAFPNINYNVVLVQTTYPGATADETEKLITIPLEKEIRQIDDIKELFSTSSQNISVISAIIEDDAPNKDRVVNEIQRAVDRTEDLPADLETKPVVNDLKTSDIPIIEVTLSGDIDETALRVAAKQLQKDLELIDDVSRVSLRGYRDREVSVELDPALMQQNHVGFDQVMQALWAQNRAVPGGKYYINGQEHILRTSGEFKNKEDVARTIVRASPLGKSLAVSDIATIQDDFEETTRLNRAGGSPAINLVIIKRSDGDAIRLVSTVKKTVADFLTRSDTRLKVSYVNDLSYFIERRLNVLIVNGVMGLALVIVCMFVFMSPGSAMGAVLGIPSVLLATFAAMHVMGITINLISMFGLIMVIGMIVDEDIVIAENVHRYLEMGLTPDEAAIKGAQEVGTAVIATALTTLAAFAPLYVMGGIIGRYVQVIPIVVCITLAFSLLEALVILPSHVAELTRLEAAKLKNQKASRANRAYLRFLNGYRALLNHTLKHRYLYLLGLVGMIAFSYYIASQHMLIKLFPDKGIEQFYIRIEGEPDDSLETTLSHIEPVEKWIAQLPAEELEAFQTEIGIHQNDPHDPFTYRASHVAQIKVFLTPEARRQRGTAEIIESLRQQLDPPHAWFDVRTPLKQWLKGFSRIGFEIVRTGPPVGKPVLVRIRGDDFGILEDAAREYITALNSLKGVTDVRHDRMPGKSELRVVVDPVKAAQTGLTVNQIATSVRQGFEGISASTIRTSEEEIHVTVRFPRTLRHQPEALSNLLITNTQGQLIPLKGVAQFEITRGIDVISHYDGVRVINVTAGVDDRIITPDKVKRELNRLLPDMEKKHPGCSIHFGGEAEDTDESIHNLMVAFVAAVGLILLILIYVFKSILQSLLVLITIPLSIIGVIIAFKLHGEPISFMAIMGIVGLTGIVVDSALIMIDFINSFARGGMPFREAIIEGATLRLRPILLTTLSTALGVIPSAYGIGGSDPFVTPMALAMNYGLTVGAILTVIFLPLSLQIIEDMRGMFRRK